MKKILCGVGVLALLALLVLSFISSPAVAGFARGGLVFGVAMAMMASGIAIFPRRPGKRPIVRRELLIGASVGLLAGAAMLVLNSQDCVALLAVMFAHPLTGVGGTLLAAVLPGITAEQVQEFQRILGGLQEYKSFLQEAPKRMELLETQNTDLRTELNRLRKAGLAGVGSGVRWLGDKPFVSEDCARALTSVFVCGVARIDGALNSLISDEGTRKSVLALASHTLGVQMKDAMTGTEIPLPTTYVGQIVELVWKYGQARQYATVFPSGSGTLKLPRLKAGEDDFGYFGAGTAGMSQAITERKVAADLVTFTLNKAGGLVRLPFELSEDSFIPVGQFLARYISRQLAKLEDKTLFLADGTATYASQKGVAQYCAENVAYLLQLGAGKTKPSDATLDDFRNLRSLVSGAILAGGFDAAYYVSSTFEPMLRGFNKYPNFIVYESQNGQPKFDGWPVRWIGVSQSYSTAAAAAKPIAFFGDLSFWYLAERGQPRVEVSKDVFFSTDEIALRALERIDVEAMAVDAMATLKTAAQ